MGSQTPPINREFRPGISGNPGGRPRGSGNFLAALDEILDEPMRVEVDGRQVVMTGRQALGIRMVDRAAAGDVRIIQLLQRYGFFERTNEPMVIWLSESLAGL